MQPVENSEIKFSRNFGLLLRGDEDPLASPPMEQMEGLPPSTVAPDSILRFRESNKKWAGKLRCGHIAASGKPAFGRMKILPLSLPSCPIVSHRRSCMGGRTANLLCVVRRF